MKKDIRTSKQIIKALSIGLSAGMMLQPISANANEIGMAINPTEGFDPDNVAEAESVEETYIADEELEAAGDACATASKETADVLKVAADMNKAGDISENLFDTISANEAEAYKNCEAAVSDVKEATDWAVSANDALEEEKKEAETVSEKVEEAIETVSGADAIVEGTEAIIDEDTKAIANATTISDAQSAYTEITEVYNEAAEALDEKASKLSEIEAEYDAALKAYETARNTFTAAVKSADDNLDEAKEKLDKASYDLTTIKAEVEEAKKEVDEATAGALDILAKQELCEEDTGLVWTNEDKLMISILENYIATDSTAEKVKGVGNNDYNYFKVTDKEGNVSYYDFKMDGASKDEIVIYTVSEDEVEADKYLKENGLDAEKVYTYFIGEEKHYVAASEIEKGNTGALEIATVDGKNYVINGETGEAYEVYNFDTTDSTLDSDNIHEDIKSEEADAYHYELDSTGNVIKAFTNNVETITYKKTASESEYNFLSEREANEAMKRAETNEGVDKVVSEATESETYYTADGTYTESFSKAFGAEIKRFSLVEFIDTHGTWKVWKWTFSEENCKNKNYKEYQNKNDDAILDAGYTIDGWSMENENALYGALTDVYGHQKVWGTADYHAAAQAVSGVEKESYEEAVEAWNELVAKASKNDGINGISGSTSNGYTTSFKVSEETRFKFILAYLTKASDETAEQVMSKIDVEECAISENAVEIDANYNAGNILLDENDDEDFAAFLEEKQKLYNDYVALLNETVSANDAVTDAKAKVLAAEDALDGVVKEEGQSFEDFQKKIRELQLKLDNARTELKEAEEKLDNLGEKVEEAASELAAAIERLTPAPAAEAPAAVVEIEETVTPLAIAPVAATVVAPAPVEVVEEEIAEEALEAETVEIIEEATPEAAPEIETVAIAEEDVPEADVIEDQAKMSWWWLLIVLVLGTTGAELYRRHQVKKNAAKVETTSEDN